MYGDMAAISLYWHWLLFICL